MQHWIYNLVLTSAEGGIKNSPTPARKEAEAAAAVGGDTDTDGVFL